MSKRQEETHLDFVDTKKGEPAQQVGVSRLFEKMVSDDIAVGKTVILLDPKADIHQLEKMYLQPGVQIDPIETYFSQEAIDEMAKSASDYLDRPGHIPKGYQGIDEEAAKAILNNPNTKVFMRVPDNETAELVTEHFKRRFDPENTVSGSQIVDPHGDPELAQKIVAVAADEGRNSDFRPVVAKNANDANLGGPGSGLSYKANMVWMLQKILLNEMPDRTAGLVILDKTSPQADVDKWREFLCNPQNAEGLSEAASDAFFRLGVIRGMNQVFLKDGFPEGFGDAIRTNVNPNFKFKIEPDDERPGMVKLAEQIAQMEIDAGRKVVVVDPKGQTIENEIRALTSTLPRPDSSEAIEQIKKAVKEFRAAWQPASGQRPSLAQTYQLVAKALGFKTWEAMVAVATKKENREKDDAAEAILMIGRDGRKLRADDLFGVGNRFNRIIVGPTGSGKSMLFNLMDAGCAEEVARILFQVADITPQSEEVETTIRIIKGLPAGAGLQTFIDAYNKSSAEQLRCTPEQLEAITPLIEALAACTKPGPYGKLFTDRQDSPGVSAPNSAVTDSSVQPDSLTSEKLTVNDFLKSLEKEPYLIDFGIRCSQHIDRNKSKEENLASFQALRESFSNSGFKEFAVCCEWLSGCTKRKTINMSYSSYGLKHMVEAWMKRQGREDYYVSNGAFIAAAIHMGFDWKPDFDSPNVRFNISKKSPAILELKS